MFKSFNFAFFSSFSAHTFSFISHMKNLCLGKRVKIWLLKNDTVRCRIVREVVFAEDIFKLNFML